MKLKSIIWSRDIEIIPVSDRWYKIPHEVDFDFYLDSGRKHIHLDADFLFDGRSGPILVDYISPNLGTQAEVKAYLAHDFMYYDTTGFTFSESNVILYWTLRNKCDYSWFRAKLIYWAVESFGEEMFGTPDINSREYSNLAKIHVRHYDK